MIAYHGLAHVEIELIQRWWIPRGERGSTYDVRDLLFEAAEVLSANLYQDRIRTGASDNASGVADRPLRELAEEAADRGTKIAIETMPFSIIATVPMGADIVAAADHPAVGLLVDAWHVFRAGTSLEELRESLTPEMIFGVELDDAADRGRGHTVRGHGRPSAAVR